MLYLGYDILDLVASCPSQKAMKHYVTSDLDSAYPNADLTESSWVRALK